MRKIKVFFSSIMGMLFFLCGAQAGHWNYNVFDYQYDMMAYVSLQIDGQMMPVNADYEIAAFVGDECRGVAVCETVSDGGYSYYSLRIRSNEESGETVTFKYYDVVHAIEKDVETILTFEHQSIVGVPSKPLILEYRNKYRLTYLLDGAEYSVDSIAYGTELVQKEALIKEGHTFSGWSGLPATMPAEDVTVTGSFTINRYLLAFVLDGDTIATDSVTYGMSFTIPEIPAKEGYTFSGWGEVPEVMPAEDVVLIGEYRLNEEQTDAQGLTYRLNEACDAFAVSGYTVDLVANVTVPETLYGLPVNTIQDKALYGAYGLETILVPASVSQVGTQAFGGCYGLLVMEWNAETPLRAECFDEADNYGNMLVFTTSATDFTGNVVVNGVAEEITLTDGLPLRNPKAFTAGRISYSREFTKKTKIGVAGGWEGIVLPFDVQRIISEEKGELQPFGQSDFTNAGLPCWIAEMQADATFGLVDKISANRPFIIEVPNSDEYEEGYNIEGTVIFTSGDVTVHATDVQSATSESGFLFTGAYEGVGATPYVYALNEEEYTATDGSVFLPGGAFVSDLRDVRPFEAYLYNEQLTRMRYLPINGGMATGIDRILKEKADNHTWYTLQGIRLNGKPTQRGLYIHGNKVVMFPGTSR